jgi:rhodanese-related sulfurtransferase
MTTIPETSVHELKTLKDNNADFFLLDVRDQWEYDICNLEGHLIPIKDLPQRLGELNPAQKIVVHCQAGGRSSRATQFLLQQGFAERGPKKLIQRCLNTKLAFIITCKMKKNPLKWINLTLLY